MTAPTPITDPFPGLRPFEPSQADIFFGRDEQIEELVDRLQKHRFVAVVGTSGSGKSSLVRAGLIPVLEHSHVGFMASRWRIAILRPGRNATVELASVLSKSFEDSQELVLTVLRASSAGLAKYARDRLDSGESLLLLVDQFEELFRYREPVNADLRAEGSAAFVKLLLAASGHNDHPLPGLDDVPVYVVMTMRSDFLGRCSQFRGLPEVLNESQYLVPRMTRDEQREAIEGPVGMAAGRVAAPLVQRLLNEVGNNPDQLPVLQHVLMRIWEHSSDERARGNAIEVKDYDAVGGMSEALNRDANQAFADLQGDEGKIIARHLFQRLVEPGAPDEETRRPTALSEIVAVTDDQEANVRQVIEVFRARGFITISGDKDPIVDISHESLIRNWKQLSEWVLQESRSAALYRRLADTAEQFGKHEAGLLSDPQLQLALNWREETRPNAAWAKRYHSGFAEAMAFLEESRKQREEEIKKTERQRKRGLRRARLTAVVFAGFFIIAGVAFVVAVRAKQDAVKQHADRNRLLYDADIYVAQRSAEDGQFPLGQNLLDELLAPDTKDLRGFEWFLLWRVVHPSDARLTGHTGSVTAVTFSPDGKTLASGSEDAKVKLWDAASRMELATLGDHLGEISALAFSPDGKTLAGSSLDNTVKLWDIASHQEVATLSHSKPVRSVAYSPDGKTLATSSDDMTVKLWDTASRKELATLTGHQASVAWAIFSPDGKTLATGSEDKNVKLWDTASRRELKTLSGHSGPVWAVAFSPDGKTLASGSDDNTVKLWNIASGKVFATLDAHVGPVWAVVFSPDGQTLATGSLDNTVKLWNSASLEKLTTLTHSQSVLVAVFAPDGKTLATGSKDQSVTLWDTTARKGYAMLEGHAGPISAVAFSPVDGKILASGEEKTVRLWDTASRKEVATLMGYSGVSAIAFSPGGKTVAAGSLDNTAKLWDTSGNEVAKFVGHSNPVLAVAFSPDGNTLATGSADATVKLWDIRSRQLLTTIRGCALPAADGAQSPSDKDANSVCSVRALDFSPDGKTLAIGSDDESVKLWDVVSHQERALTMGHSDSVTSVTFSRDGKILASGSLDKTVKLWDTASGKVLATLAGHSNFVQAVAFSPDGKTVASGSLDRTVKLWDTASGKELARLTGYLDSVSAVAFSPDGRTLATGSLDKTVKLWFAATDTEIADRRHQ